MKQFPGEVRRCVRVNKTAVLLSNSPAQGEQKTTHFMIERGDF